MSDDRQQTSDEWIAMVGAPVGPLASQPTPSPLTRFELEQLAECFPYDMLERYKAKLLAHDAALRATIEQQAQEIAQLNTVLRAAGWGQGEIDSAAYTFDKLATANSNLVQERDELKYRLQVNADLIGETEHGLRQQLSDAQATIETTAEQLHATIADYNDARQQVARLREAAKRLLVVRSQVCDGVAVWATEWDDLDQVLRETGA